MLLFVSGILSAILPCLAYDDEARISILVPFCSEANDLCT